MRILIDTNVYLDVLLKREDFEDANLVFTNCIVHNHSIFITPIMLRDIEYIVHRRIHDSIKAREAMMAAYHFVTKVIGISPDNTINAMYSDMKDYEDSLNAESAQENLIDLVVTHDIKDYANSGMKVVTPKEFNTFISGTY